MIPANAEPLLLASAADTGYQIERSLRFNSSDSAYCSRVPASAGNRKTWSWAAWVKRSALGTNQTLLCSVTANGQSTNFTLIFGTGDKLGIEYGTNYWLQTTQVFRDTSAWFHLQLAVDTTQATSSERMKLWVNGSQVTAFDINTPPAQNTDLAINRTELHTIGSLSTSLYFSGYLADIHFIDGQALTPSSFTEVSATTGQLVPIEYTGTYGTNGFHLDFADNASTTTIGYDAAGSNNWTPNNLSVTAGVGNDSLVDTPTSYGTDTGAGGEVRGNFCTWNPLDKDTNLTLANGNLDSGYSGSGSWSLARGTIGISSGKWYWEITAGTASHFLGIANGAHATNTWYVGGSSLGYGYWGVNGQKAANGGAGQSYGATYTTGDVIGVAFDADNWTLTFYKNGVSQGTAFTSITSSSYFPAVSTSASSTASANFGQRPFAYTAPSGFKALCDQNLPAPTIALPSEVMDVKLYSGTGSNQAVTGLGFSPDFVWIKRRNLDRSHMVFDAVRGLPNRLATNETSGDNTDTNNLVSFDSTGFTTSTGDAVNGSGGTYVGWCWDAGSSTVANTQGSISSQVRANASAGFSIVTYTGTGANATVGHGLGVTPSFIIVKSRSNTTDWQGYHGALGKDYTIQLMSTGAAINVSNYWNGGVSSTTFGINGAYDGINANGYTYVAYCFSPVAGYSSFGSYTGNGSTDGPFVFTGFRPRWVMIKRSDSASASYGWFILDTARNTYNVMNTWLAADNSAADGADIICDTVANGFKIRTTAGNINTNAGTFVYACFAESPFAYARAR